MRMFTSLFKKKNNKKTTTTKKTIAKECIRNPEALHFKSWAIFSLFLLEAEKQM